MVTQGTVDILAVIVYSNNEIYSEIDIGMFRRPNRDSVDITRKSVRCCCHNLLGFERALATLESPLRSSKKWGKVIKTGEYT